MMQAVPYNLQGQQISNSIPKWKKFGEEEEEKISVVVGGRASSIESEPTSTLDTTSTCTLSSSFNGSRSGVTGLSEGIQVGFTGKDNVGLELQNLHSGLVNGVGMEEWESLFPTGDGSLVPWISGEADELGLGLKHVLESGNHVDFGGNVDSGLGFCGSISTNCSSGFVDCKVSNNGLNSNWNPQVNSLSSRPINVSIPGSLQQILSPQMAQKMQNPSFSTSNLVHCQMDQNLCAPQAKRHNPGVVLEPSNVHVSKTPFRDLGHEFFEMSLAHQLIPQQQLQEQFVKDHLLKAANLIQTGNFSLAHEILARLNHSFSFPAKPFIKAALYVKEALLSLLISDPVLAKKSLTPYDIFHKMSAYKMFSEVTPITQFINFTCIQAILESLNDSDSIHIIDFDVGFGAQWASLIQELSLRKRGAPSLKITAFASLSMSHPFELSLIRDNLTQFASDVGVSFEFQVVNSDSFEPSTRTIPTFRVSGNETVVVNIPTSVFSYRLPSILHFINRHSPSIVVSSDRGFDRSDILFPQHLIHIVESCSNLLESLDGLNVASDAINKIEKFLIQPNIESTVLARLHAPSKMPHWRNLFASAGFLPLQFSNFTETQADYVVKRTPGRGFHVEKCQASLVLSWQNRELVTVSAWKC